MGTNGWKSSGAGIVMFKILISSPQVSKNGRLEYVIGPLFEDEDISHLDKGQTLFGWTDWLRKAFGPVAAFLVEHDVNQGAIYLNGHDIGRLSPEAAHENESRYYVL